MKWYADYKENEDNDLITEKMNEYLAKEKVNLKDPKWLIDKIRLRARKKIEDEIQLRRQALIEKKELLERLRRKEGKPNVKKQVFILFSR